PLSRCATASRRTSACAANPNFRASRFSIPPYTISPPKSHPFSWNVNSTKKMKFHGNRQPGRLSHCTPLNRPRNRQQKWLGKGNRFGL
ncbi:MAG: hypothetical protein ACK5WY_08795, partial [Holosporaceae bacterium]